MKGIPSTPTDNIYKFMAIALYIWMVNTQIQLYKESLKTQSYFFSVNMERKIENRLDSIKNKNFDENILDWVHRSYTPEQEKNFITKALDNHKETIKNNKGVLDSNIGEGLKLLERWDIRIAGGLYVFLMVGLTWFGFSRWVTKTHLVDEKLRVLDLEIKEKTLKKLELEIKQLKLTSQSTSRLRHRAH